MVSVAHCLWCFGVGGVGVVGRWFDDVVCGGAVVGCGVCGIVIVYDVGVCVCMPGWGW